MPYYLRAIHSMLEWHNPDYASWLRQNELPSCIVRDLRADDNALSLWEIADDQSNLLDIIAAFVSSSSYGLKDNFDSFFNHGNPDWNWIEKYLQQCDGKTQ